LERIKDAHILRLIEQIGVHYRTNISNRFLRPIILQMQIDKSTWDQIELLTEKTELFIYNGVHIDDLYKQIAACARFVELARNSVVPSLRTKLNAIPGGHDKTLRDMAANNFVSNLKVFADLLHELYMNIVELDKAHCGKGKPVYTQISELHSLGYFLAGS